MVDISLEILASSVPLRSGQSFRYRIKTWWTHIDVPTDKTMVKLPRLPMIQQYLIMTGKDATVFVETWYEEREVDVSSIRKPKFIGMTVCSVDEQLKNPTINPSVQWLDVRDPVENIQKGKLLLKLDAKFALPTTTNDKKELSNVSDCSQSGVPSQFVSPQRTMAAHFPKSCNSALSDASGTSAASAWRNLQEQAVQTDLSLLVLPSPSIPVSHSKTSPEDRDREYFCERKNDSATQQRRLIYKSTKSTADVPPSAIIDPLQIAQDIMRRNFTEDIHENDTLRFQGLSKCRRPYIPKQKSHLTTLTNSDNQHGSNAANTNNYNLESVGQVIDILNPKATGDNFCSQHDPRIGSHNDVSKKNQPHATATDYNFLHQTKSSENSSNFCDKTNFRSLDLTKIRLAPEGSSAINKEVVQSGSRRDLKIEKHSSVVSDQNDKTFQISRFKEVHFDGTRAQEQAAALINVNTSKPPREINAALSRTNSLPPRPVTRRRIAAAIFEN